MSLEFDFDDAFDSRRAASYAISGVYDDGETHRLANPTRLPPDGTLLVSSRVEVGARPFRLDVTLDATTHIVLSHALRPIGREL